MRISHAHGLLFGILGLLAIDCGPSSDQPDLDAGHCSGSETFCGTDPAGKDICVDLSTDASNCGACFSECRMPEANACVEGQCACDGQAGLSDPCDVGTACVAMTGQCIHPNYEATQTCDPIEGTGCTDDRMVCADGFCTIPDCSEPEVCDGRDNDCNGHLDTTGPTPGQSVPLTETCYGGTPGTENVGICTIGTRTCRDGSYPLECPGEQIPIVEDGLLLCDGIDNDCDTCADNGWNEAGVCVPPRPFKADIIVVVDRSGSMVTVIDSQVQAFQAWASDIGMNPSVRFGLVNPTTNNDPDGVSVALPLSGYVEFNAALSTVHANEASYEPMHYAVQKIMRGDYDAVLGTDHEALRIVITVHDESTLNTNHVAEYDETSMCSAIPNDATLVVITRPYLFEEWDGCTSESGTPPTAVPLTGDWATTLAALKLIIDTPCS